MATNSTNAKTFALDLRELVGLLGDELDTIATETVIAIGTNIVNRSPVGDPSNWKNPKSAPPGYTGGHFRVNWQYGYNSLPPGQISGIDAGGQTTIDRLTAGVKSSDPAGVHYLANNLPYAVALEYGHSQVQAPHGMVGLCIVDFQGWAEEATRRARASHGRAA
jgi:hypothetical protein